MYIVFDVVCIRNNRRGGSLWLKMIGYIRSAGIVDVLAFSFLFWKSNRVVRNRCTTSLWKWWTFPRGDFLLHGSDRVSCRPCWRWLGSTSNTTAVETFIVSNYKKSKYAYKHTGSGQLNVLQLSDILGTDRLSFDMPFNYFALIKIIENQMSSKPNSETL